MSSPPHYRQKRTKSLKRLDGLERIIYPEVPSVLLRVSQSRWRALPPLPRRQLLRRSSSSPVSPGDLRPSPQRRRPRHFLEPASVCALPLNIHSNPVRAPPWPARSRMGRHYNEPPDGVNIIPGSSRSSVRLRFVGTSPFVMLSEAKHLWPPNRTRAGSRARPRDPSLPLRMTERRRRPHKI